MIHTILDNSQLRPAVQHNLTYTDCRKGGSSPAPIDEQHLLEFEVTEKVIADDPYGKGEYLFARKFSEDSGALIRQLDALFIRRKKDMGL